MSRRGAGIILVWVAAFLFGVRYISASILGSESESWDQGFFAAMLGHTGSGLLVAGGVALAAGIIYIIWAEVADKRRR